MLQRPSVVGDNSLEARQRRLNKNQKQVRMSEVHDLYDGQVRIYKTTHSGDVWQLRMWIAQEKKYIRKSLKTRDLPMALRLAENAFIEYKARLLNGEKLFSMTASELRDKYLDYIAELVQGNQLSVGRQTNIKTFTKHYLEFVGKDAKIRKRSTNPRLSHVIRTRHAWAISTTDGRRSCP